MPFPFTEEELALILTLNGGGVEAINEDRNHTTDSDL